MCAERRWKSDPCGLRPANREYHSEYDGNFEIVKNSGILSIHGSHPYIFFRMEMGKRFSDILSLDAIIHGC